MNKETQSKVAAAIAAAVELVTLSKKQDDCIPVILRAVGCEKAPKPWVIAKEVLVAYRQSLAIPGELVAQRDLLVDLDRRRTDLRSRLEVKFDKVLNTELVRAHAGFQKAMQRFEELKAKHCFEEKLSDVEARIEKMGLMDLLGLRAADLTAAIHAEKAAAKPAKAERPEAKHYSLADIYTECCLDAKTDRQVADLIAYLRNMVNKTKVKIKKHSKPRKRVEVDEDAVKMDCYAVTAERNAKAAARYKACYKGAKTLLKVA
jgi:hypothetical protein